MLRFYGYNPHDGSPPRLRRACERCHSRKVRCDIGSGKGPCSNCATYGDDCKLQLRKRKTTARKAQSNAARERPDANQRQIVHAPATRSPQSHSSVLLHPCAELSSSPLVFIQGFASFATPPNPSISSGQESTDGLRNSSFINRSAILPDGFPGLDHSNGSTKQNNNHQLSERELKVLELYNAFDLPPVPVRQSLVEAYFEKCWTWMPVVDPEIFSESSPKAPSYLMLQALFLAGLQMRKGASSYASSEEYFVRVKALLNTGFERDPLTILAALCMVQWWNPNPPTDVSTDTSRFWATYGVYLAQQAGLHRKPATEGPDSGLRRRIWWTLYSRDNSIALAQGRPRMINLADCTIERPTVNDFPNPNDRRAQVFIAYIDICGIVGDLCQLLSRTKSPSIEAREAIGVDLLNWIRGLPPSLRLYNEDGSSRPYDFEIAQLHAPFFSAVTILFRPRSNFQLRKSNAAAVVASIMNSRLYEAFQLRDQTYFLAGTYAWHFLVAAILQLSCTRIPALKEEAEASLAIIEEALRTLGEKSPSAANNYRNVQVLRKAFESSNVRPADSSSTPREAFSFPPTALFDTFGPEVSNTFSRIEGLLPQPVTSNPVNPVSAVPDNSGPSNTSGLLSFAMPSDPLGQGFFNANEDVPGRDLVNDIGVPMGSEPNMTDEYSQLLDSRIGRNNWMMDWIDDLNL